MMSVTTAASYGAPPVSLTAMTAGASVAPQTQHPIIKWGVGAYAVLLIGVAALYYWRGRK